MEKKLPKCLEDNKFIIEFNSKIFIELYQHIMGI